MWPWLRNELSKNSVWLTQRQQFLGRLCIFTFVCHIVVLFLAIFCYKGNRESERFVVSAQKRNTVYVLTPLQKKAKQAAISKKSQASVASSKVINYETYQKLKNKKQGVKKSVPKPASKKGSSLTLASLKTNKNVAKNKTNQPVLKKPLMTIVDVTIVEPEKKKPKIEVAKSVPKQEIKPEPKVEPVIELTQPEVIVESVKEEKEIVSEQIDDSSSEPDFEELDLDDVTFIGYEQFDSLAVQNKIQQVVQQNFKSPIGVGKDVTCELSVLVGPQGKSGKVTMVKSSGVRVYDVAARAMLSTIEFPKEVWNKTITIVLGQ